MNIWMHFCQGKCRFRCADATRNGKERTKYEQIQAMIRNFDQAMLHPDRADEAAAADFAVQVWKRIDHDVIQCAAPFGATKYKDHFYVKCKNPLCF
ncbi:MAG: hypothetical protein ACLURV_10255 [Gallintestinimicrobium sp.]